MVNQIISNARFDTLPLQLLFHVAQDFFFGKIGYFVIEAFS